MKCSPKRRSVLALAISGLVFTSAVGCGDGDQRAADKRIRQTVAKATDARRIPTTQNVQAAVTDLNGVVSKDANAASFVGKIDAKSNLAQAELEAGRRQARELARIQPQVLAAVWEIAALGERIEQLNADAAATMKATPDATLKGIADERAKMVAAADAAGKKAAELQGEVDKIKAQVDQKTKEKDELAKQADDLSDKASKASGKEASDLADQANEARRKAGNLGHDADQVSAGLVPLEHDLAVEQQKKKTADDAVAALDANKASVEALWQGAQGKASDQKSAAGKLAQDLAARAQRLDALTKEAADIRAKAADFFTKSAQHSAAAASDATNLARELRTWGGKFPTEKKAWDQLLATYSPGTFKLAEAEAQNALGNLQNEHALELAQRAQVAAAVAKPLQDAGVQVPASLSPAVAAEQKQAAAAAAAAYNEAAQRFIDVYSGGGTAKELQNSAHVSRIFSLYGQYIASGDRSKLADAKQEYTEAFSERQDDPITRVIPSEVRTGTAGGAAPAPTPGAPGTPAAPTAPAPRGGGAGVPAAPTTPAPTTPAPGGAAAPTPAPGGAATPAPVPTPAPAGGGAAPGGELNK